MFPCDKGMDGFCCCNCTKRKPLYRHPGNSWNGKGRITELFGHICMGFHDNYIFFEIEKEHGMCELHELKEKES